MENASQTRQPNLRLRAARKQRGWTQEEAADQIGVSVATYRRWENEGIKPPRANMQRLCAAFDVKDPAEVGFSAQRKGSPVPDIPQSATVNIPAPTVDITGGHRSVPASPRLSRREVIGTIAAGAAIAAAGTGATLFFLSQRVNSDPPEILAFSQTLVYNKHEAQIKGVAWHPRGEEAIASVDVSGIVRVWSPASGKDLISSFRCFDTKPDKSPDPCLAWSPDGTSLAVAGEPGVYVFPISSRSQRIVPAGRPVSYSGHKGAARACAWSPDGESLVSAEGQTLWIWSLAGQPPRSIPCSATITTVDWSPDSQFLLAGTMGNQIYCYNALTWQQVGLYPGHAKQVNTVAWHPAKGSPLFASVSDDGSVRVWNIAHKQAIWTYQNAFTKVDAVAWSNDGRYLAAGCGDKEQLAYIWKMTATHPANESCICSGNNQEIHNLAWSYSNSASGNHALASGGNDHSIRIWRLDGFLNDPS